MYFPRQFNNLFRQIEANGEGCCLGYREYMRVNELGNTFLYGFHITIYGGTKVVANNIRWKGSSLHKKMSSHFVDSNVPKENGESYLLTMLLQKKKFFISWNINVESIYVISSVSLLNYSFFYWFILGNFLYPSCSILLYILIVSDIAFILRHIKIFNSIFSFIVSIHPKGFTLLTSRLHYHCLSYDALIRFDIFDIKVQRQ